MNATPTEIRALTRLYETGKIGVSRSTCDRMERKGLVEWSMSRERYILTSAGYNAIGFVVPAEW